MAVPAKIEDGAPAPPQAPASVAPAPASLPPAVAAATPSVTMAVAEKPVSPSEMVKEGSVTNINKVGWFDDVPSFKKRLEMFLDGPIFVSFMMILTFWALFSNDIRVSALSKEADAPFEIIITIAFFLFVFEIIATSIVKPQYIMLPDWEAKPGETQFETWTRRCMFGDFYFWLDWLATLTLLFEISWALGSVGGSGGGSGAQSAKAVRLVRLVRMVRLVRLVKLYKYAQQAKELQKKKAQRAAKKAAGEKVDTDDDIEIEESHVGAAMADITNRRVLILILVMLIVVPVLTVSQSDLAADSASFVIHSLAANASSSGVEDAVTFVRGKMDVISVVVTGAGAHNFQYIDQAMQDASRASAITKFSYTTGTVNTKCVFDTSAAASADANFSIMTTCFVMMLLLLGTYAFSTDVEELVIEPIEKMVGLVKKISADPLGVNYDAMGRMEGFAAGMETTILLTTIAKLGGLMRVGFGQAGAAVIARNLKGGTGKLNLMAGGTGITSIFGFCDVRQFTDTTECLQEEVMLFVNRIAHILHSIVVQCDGSANKNIGDAFLITWKLEETYSAEECTVLADKALLSFCRAHIELCKYQDHICNFTAAATERLFKRFPTYRVRLGTGLHVGWAIEGAIGSNRKIDATYLSPHVNMSEFLESSTKTYGVSLLMSEPFYKLLSPTAKKYCRQVDRLRRNTREEPLGIYCYDTDLNVDFWEVLETEARKKKGKQRTSSDAGVGNVPAPRRGSVQTPSRVAIPTDSKARVSGGVSGKKNSGSRERVGGSSSDRGRNSGERGTGSADRHGGSSGSGSNERTGKNAHHAKFEDLEAFAAEEKRKLEVAPQIILPEYTTDRWTEDLELVELRWKVTDKFRTVWQGGVEAYVKGDWAKARDVFQETMKLSNNKDGPSIFLISIIDEHHGKAPDNWLGYREDI